MPRRGEPVSFVQAEGRAPSSNADVHARLETVTTSEHERPELDVQPTRAPQARTLDLEDERLSRGRSRLPVTLIDDSTRAYASAVDKGAKMLHGLSMPAIGTTTLHELSAALKKARAKLSPSEVHALYLGAMTSTNPRFGPQHLIEQILGEDEDGAPNDDPPMALIGAILGYWNHLQEEREAGRVRLAAADLPKSANQDEILAYAERRGHELDWYLRGLAAGGEDPRKRGSTVVNALQRIAEASAYFSGLVKLLGRAPFTSTQAKEAAHENVVMLTRTAESLIADLIENADETRRRAPGVVTPDDDRTHDQMPIRRGPRIGRNDPCPCASGKKYKRCCGSLATMQ